MGVKTKVTLLCLALLATTSSSGDLPFTRTECAELPATTITSTYSLPGAWGSAERVKKLEEEVIRQNGVIRCLQRDMENLKREIALLKIHPHA